MLDMIEGKLSFSRNGEDWGVAFDTPELKQGTLVPAVAMINENDEC